ncbi:hypothetical protein ACFPIK_14055 [Algoriphagus aquatilis]|uniref:GIY-YIG domain-containing protein n=1 Tax=Algoriphagus aquatilis TaxID=490186 RepID=A0ABW0C0M9_9BACT
MDYRQILEFIVSNSSLLFTYTDENPLKTKFNKKGFFFSHEAEQKYSLIKNKPHIYFAWSESSKDIYIGKSFQKGGRWKRGHSYHLGTLAYHLLNNLKPYDQNHQHWIDKWMCVETFKEVSETDFEIFLKNKILITFLPFEMYHSIDPDKLTKKEIKKINKEQEEKLIFFFQENGFSLLNIQLNRNLNNSI